MKKIKIQVYCDTGFSGCKHNYVEEFDKDEWDSMDEREKERYLADIATDNMSNHIDYGAYVIEDGSEGEES
jgi:uncharacterized protein YaaW (UPF0174 family)